MEELFESPVLSSQIKQIEEKQQEAIKSLTLAINAVNESMDLSSSAFDKFNSYSKQVERIRDTIQDTYFRINKLKARVEQYKVMNITDEFHIEWCKLHNKPLRKSTVDSDKESDLSISIDTTNNHNNNNTNIKEEEPKSKDPKSKDPKSNQDMVDVD